jgi:hypothetical protein
MDHVLVRVRQRVRDLIERHWPLAIRGTFFRRLLPSPSSVAFFRRLWLRCEAPLALATLIPRTPLVWCRRHHGTGAAPWTEIEERGE